MGYFDKHLTIKLLYSQQFSDSKIASPLRCNRVAVTVQSRCRYGVTAMGFGKKAADGAAKGHLEAIFPLYLTLFPSVKFWQ